MDMNYMKKITLQIVLLTALWVGCRLTALCQPCQPPTFEKLTLLKDGISTPLNIDTPDTLKLTEGETCTLEARAENAVPGKAAFIMATGLVSSWMHFVSPGEGAATLTLLPGDEAHTSEVDGHYEILFQAFDTIPECDVTELKLPVYIIDRNALKAGDTELVIINYPNPVTATANYVTTLDYIVPVGGQGALRIYSLSGQKVMTVFEDTSIVAGHYFRTINLSSLPAGTYVYRLTVDGLGSKSGRLIKQ
jgi:hypothetical protein